jgi:hypothetical protein
MATRHPLRTSVPWDIQRRFDAPTTGAPPRQDDVPQSQRTEAIRLIYPPWVEKLPESVDFNAQDFAIALAAVAGQTVTSANLRFALPRGMIGWLQGFSIYLLTPTALTSVQWTLRINNGPVPGWENVQNSPGVANIYREDFTDLRVRIPTSGIVDVLITNLTAAGPWTVGGRLQGWHHSPEAESNRYGTI